MKEQVLVKFQKLVVKSKHWRHHFTQEELEWLQDFAPFINISSCFFSEIRFAVLNKVRVQPVCPVCGAPTQYNPRKTSYRTFCSKECELSKEGVQARLSKASTTNLEKYGVENAIASESVKAKVKQTLMEKYGVENAMQVAEFKESHQKTVMDKYGVKNISSTDLAKNNRKKTMLNKYGVDHMSKSEEIKEKKRQTFLAKYGVENVSQSEPIRAKKSKEQREEYWGTFCKLLKQRHIVPLFNKEDYISYDFDKGYKSFLCERCGTEFKTENLKVGKIYCASHIYDSLGELNIFDFIVNELGYKGVVQRNKKIWYDGKSLELDLYLPELKLGIEHNGLFWHSEIHISSDYHFKKYKFFKDQGIKVIQIFENEWLENPIVVKSLLRSALGIKPSYTVYARNTTIKEISNSEYLSFCSINHLQGYAPAKFRYGMFHQGKLVALISFAKPLHNSTYDFEIVRYCIDMNTIVVGAFPKLLKHFRKEHNGSIITYADLRYFDGNTYLKAGFKYLHNSKPSYFYFNKNDLTKLVRRTSVQKHKLSLLLPTMDESKTDHENMLKNNYFRVYDAGAAVFVLH